MNKCDLEEMKHLAYQKFLEVVKRPQEWSRQSGYYSHACGAAVVQRAGVIGSPPVRSAFHLLFSHAPIKEEVNRKGDAIGELEALCTAVDAEFQKRADAFHCKQLQEALLPKKQPLWKRWFG